MPKRKEMVIDGRSYVIIPYAARLLDMSPRELRKVVDAESKGITVLAIGRNGTPPRRISVDGERLTVNDSCYLARSFVDRLGGILENSDLRYIPLDEDDVEVIPSLGRIEGNRYDYPPTMMTRLAYENSKSSPVMLSRLSTHETR